VSLPQPYWTDGKRTIYHADCRDILPHLPKVDLVLTDPPYGMGFVAGFSPGPNGYGGPKERTKFNKQRVTGDESPPDIRWVTEYPRAVVWGFHHFADQLGPGGLLVWIKREESAYGTFLSDADAAWVKGSQGVYCKKDMTLYGLTSGRKAHPTQKPLSIMTWSIQKAGGDGLILDPFTGSGTTLLGAKQLGREAIGIEIEEKYCEIAAKRLSQQVLFDS
jgi:DNA modification methylase